MVALFRAIALCAALVALGSARKAPSADTIARLRAYEKPQVLTLESAKALHADLVSRSRTIETLHGHTHRTAPMMRPAPPPGPPAPPAPPAPAPSPSNSSRLPVIYPTNFGADPTGRNDSTDAFAAAMKALLATVPMRKMASNISDLGGITLDLGGGQYVINAPVVVPPYFGNINIQRGTLRAGPKFPQDSWLIEIGAYSCNPPDGQGSCNEFINVMDVLLDANETAQGGVYVAHTMGTTIGPAFIIGFVKAGIQLDGGHEVMVTDSWLAETYWSDPRPKQSTSTGIIINGNDHFLNNVIVFEYAHIGVQVNGAANILSGVHTWNLGGTGILVASYQNRLIGCYLDFDTLVIIDPNEMAIENTFFLSTNTVFQAHTGVVSQVVMRFNTYAAGGPTIQLDGVFKKASGVYISEEIGGNKVTRVRSVLNQTMADTWDFDFSGELLFPWIDHVVYSLSTPAGFIAHVARPPVGTRVSVVTSEPVSGVVSIEVSQAL